MEDVFQLSNDPLVRKNSFHSESITLEEHKQWFSNILRADKSLLYIFRDTSKALMGQVRLSSMPNGYYQISISLFDTYRGRGLSSYFIKTAIAKFPKEGVIVAWVKPENTPSFKAFKNAGFQTIKKEQVCGSIDAIRMERKC